MMVREQFVMPDFHSKYVNKEILLLMYTGEIYSIKTNQLITRNCARPPQKLILAQKMETYCSAIGAKSGLNFEKANFPDKQYLLQMVAHLSKGKDEIFSSEYIPSKGLAKEVEQQLARQPPVMFANIPIHLQAKGSGRSLKLHNLTKEEKIQAQLQMAELRIAKQNAQKEQLKKQLEVFNHRNDDQIAKMIEREKMKAEVQAEINAKAQEFVNQQIQQAHAMMYQEIERQVAARMEADRNRN